MNVISASGAWELGTEGTIWFQVIAAVISGLAAGGAVWSLFLFLSSRKRASHGAAPSTLDDKIEGLSALAESLRMLAADVTAEANAQIQVAQDAARQARENESLASLTREQAEAVSEIFAEQGRTSIRESRRLSWVSLIISVIVSNVVTVAVTVWLTNMQ